MTDQPPFFESDFLNQQKPIVYEFVISHLKQWCAANNQSTSGWVARFSPFQFEGKPQGAFLVELKKETHHLDCCVTMNLHDQGEIALYSLSSEKAAFFRAYLQPAPARVCATGWMSI